MLTYGSLCCDVYVDACYDVASSLGTLKRCRACEPWPSSVGCFSANANRSKSINVAVTYSKDWPWIDWCVYGQFNEPVGGIKAANIYICRIEQGLQFTTKRNSRRYKFGTLLKYWKAVAENISNSEFSEYSSAYQAVPHITSKWKVPHLDLQWFQICCMLRIFGIKIKCLWHDVYHVSVFVLFIVNYNSLSMCSIYDIVNICLKLIVFQNRCQLGDQVLATKKYRPMNPIQVLEANCRSSNTEQWYSRCQC